MTILFLRVGNNQAKITRLCGAVQHHYEQGHSILLCVPSTEAAQYLDQLLWRHPEDSFMPHVVSQETTKESVVITTALNNVNNASVLINLRPEIHPVSSMFATVYDIYDETQPDKLQQSVQRQKQYQEQGQQVKIC